MGLWRSAMIASCESCRGAVAERPDTHDIGFTVEEEGVRPHPGCLAAELAKSKLEACSYLRAIWGFSPEGSHGRHLAMRGTAFPMVRLATAEEAGTQGQDGTGSGRGLRVRCRWHALPPSAESLRRQLEPTLFQAVVPDVRPRFPRRLVPEESPPAPQNALAHARVPRSNPPGRFPYGAAFGRPNSPKASCPSRNRRMVPCSRRPSTPSSR